AAEKQLRHADLYQFAGQTDALVSAYFQFENWHFNVEIPPPEFDQIKSEGLGIAQASQESTAGW
ncbi:hypothetical protein GWI33_011480, partial [Rhynchophorus ferrugineus]